MKNRSVLLLAGLALLAACAAPQPDPAYVSEIREHREARENRLRQADGWLSLIGLFWLEPGANPIGSRPGSAVLLPEEIAPPEAGVLILEDDVVRIVAAPAAGVRFDGEPVGERRLRDDREGNPDLLQIGRVTFHIVERGGRYGVRIKDPESPARKEFRGLEYYPVDPDFRVEAILEPYDPPRRIAVASVTGTPTEMFVPGRLRFRLAGRELSLEPLVDAPGENELFLIFRDETSDSETYGAGRYLYADLDQGRAVLDFNLAYNPPCAFTPYATCPLPPRGNRLELPIRAGERRYGQH